MAGENFVTAGLKLDRRAVSGLLVCAAAMPLIAARSPMRTVALLMDSLTTPFWITGLETMRRQAQARGWRVLEAVSNMDDNRQFQQVQSMIERGVDGIVMVHTDNRAVIPAIRAANAANVPLVHFNRAPAPNDGYSVAVVADNRALMRQTVEAAIAGADALSDTYKAVILLGDLADANAVARRDGIHDAFDAHKDKVQIVAQVATEWNADKAFSGLQNALQAHPDINMLITSSDFMAPQIEQALRAAGKWHRKGTRGHVVIAAFDGDSGAYQRMRDGYFDADGVQDLEYEVKLAFEALEAMWAGKRPAKTLVDPGFVATSDTLATTGKRMWGYIALHATFVPPVETTTVATGTTGLTANISAVWAFVALLFSVSVLGGIALALFPLLILVLGQLLVMIEGEIDLSMPASLALASVLSASVMTGIAAPLGDGWASAAGVLTCLASGICVGAINGVAVVWGRMPSFIVTLAILILGGGAAVWYASSVSDSVSIGGLPQAFRTIGYGSWFGIPIAFIVAASIFVAIGYLLKATLFGRWLYAIGHNRRAARLSGVPVDGMSFAAFVGSGACAGFAAMLYTARVETGQPTLGANMLLDVIGAAVIGGISLAGGRGTIWMALGGAVFLAFLDKSLQLLGLSLFLVLGLKGFAVLAAAGLDRVRIARAEHST